MPTKKQQLQTIADTISLLQDQQIPHGVNPNSLPDVWNEDRSGAKVALPLIGDFFTDTDVNHATLVALFNADHDPSTGKNPVPSEWVVDAATPTFVNASQFQLVGDRRTDYTAAQRLRVKLGSSFVVVAILGSPGYDAGQNKTTVTVTPSVLGATLSEVARGLVRTSMPKVQTSDIVDFAVGTAALADKNVTTSKLGDSAVTGLKLADGAVITAKLADAAVSTAKLGSQVVTTPKLAVGSSAVHFEGAPNLLAGVSVLNGNESTAAQFTAFTPRDPGSRVRIASSLVLYGLTGGSITTAIILKIRRNGTVIANFAHAVAPLAGNALSLPLPGFEFFDQAHNGLSAAYTITVAVSGSGGSASGPSANPGIAYVEELP